MSHNALTDLGEHRTWRFFLQICLALEVIHGKGIVHADLKPSNLLMSGRDYDLKLTDFGVSEQLLFCSVLSETLPSIFLASIVHSPVVRSLRIKNLMSVYCFVSR